MEDGDLKYDRDIATPDMMSVVGKIAKILGPKGLMPNRKMGSVSSNISEAVKLAKSGQINFKAEKNGIVQAGVGKASFGIEKICENVNLFIETIKKAKPSGSKGTYVKKISISSTMGVSLNCEII
jgi:Ribosomal protein L1